MSYLTFNIPQQQVTTNAQDLKVLSHEIFKFILWF
jgi:hypothetical protein